VCPPPIVHLIADLRDGAHRPADRWRPDRQRTGMPASAGSTLKTGRVVRQ